MPHANSKTLYLTFDDGPEPEATLQVLDILDKYQIPATFFCVGERVENHAGIYKRILEKGHKTGNHTYNHLNGWKTKSSAYKASVEACAQVVESSLFRPPYGRITHRQAHALHPHYKIIMWSLLTYDFSPSLNRDTCLKRAVKKTGPGEIIVFHDNLKALPTMSYVLPRYIESCLERGYGFGGLYVS